MVEQVVDELVRVPRNQLKLNLDGSAVINGLLACCTVCAVGADDVGLPLTVMPVNREGCERFCRSDQRRGHAAAAAACSWGRGCGNCVSLPADGF